MQERPSTIDQMRETVSLPKLQDGAFDFGNGIIGPSQADREYFNSLNNQALTLIKVRFLQTETGRQPLVDRLLDLVPQRLKKPMMLMVTAGGIGVVVAACGGGSEADVPKNTAEPTIAPPATETIAPTPTPNPEPTPTPEPTKPPIKKLAEAEFVPTDYQTVLEALTGNPATGEKGVFELYPDADGTIYYKGSEVPLSEERLKSNLENCQGGADETIKFIYCHQLVTGSYYIYAEKHYEPFYDLAVKAANYYISLHPEKQAEFDNNLMQAIQQTSPSPEK